MHGNTLYRGRKPFYRYSLQAFGTSELLKCHIKDCSKSNFNRRIKMSERRVP